jgi:energy-coupling factor transporter transmembrane protein EcfT
MTDPQQPSLTPQAPPTAYEPQQPSYGQPTPAPDKVKPGRNVLGIIALAAAALGFVFACIPGALILGWILLPIGFILGVVSLFLKDKAKWQGLTAIIVSVVGTIIGFIVFFAVVATSFDDAFGGSDVEVSDPETSVVEEDQAPAEEEAGAEEEAAAEVGTRENPAAIGSTIEGEDWTVVINSVTAGATEQILAENQFNGAPDEGTEYLLINYTVTYTGSDPEGQMPVWVSIDYVTADGVTVNSLDKLVVAPDAMDTTSVLYEGATATGNTAIQVPSPVDGVIAISPGMIADKVFVATT